MSKREGAFHQDYFCDIDVTLQCLNEKDARFHCYVGNVIWRYKLLLLFVNIIFRRRGRGGEGSACEKFMLKNAYFPIEYCAIVLAV